MRLRVIAVLIFFAVCAAGARSASLSELWAERVKTVVGVEFYVDDEVGRQATEVPGVVIDDQGTIIFTSQAVNNRVTPAQLKDFRVRLPNTPAAQFYTAVYLGPDEYTGCQFIRVEEKARPQLVPVTRYAAAQPAEPAIAEELWGIGLRKKSEDFLPYFLSSRVAMVQAVPQRTAVLAHDVAGLGMPVFNAAGDFVGLTVGGYGQTFLQVTPNERAPQPVLMVNPDESSVVMLASEILPYLSRVPANINGRPLAWLGANGLQALDPEVSTFLGLATQSAVGITEVLEGSPAEKAGLVARDIIVRIDDRPLPRFKPDQAAVVFLEREIDRRRPGDVLTLGVLRDGKNLRIAVTLEDAPQLPREAARHFFDFLGITVRQFTYADGAIRRVRMAGHSGVIAHFVKPKSPAAIAGLRMDDWIKAIDGTAVENLAEAEKQLAAIEADRSRTDYTLGVEREVEPVELRIKLK